MKLFKSTLLACAMTIPMIGNAAIINVGDIQYDDTQNYMTDTQTGVLYSSLDATHGLTYSDLLLATQSGGLWEGWSFATSQESDDLLEALFQSSTPCSGANITGQVCGDMLGWTDGMLGASFNSSVDIWGYVSTNTTPGLPIQSDVGLVQIQDMGGFGRVQDFDDLFPFANFEPYTLPNAQLPAGFLLYKNEVDSEPTAAVAAPSVGVLFAMACMVLGVRRCKNINK